MPGPDCFWCMCCALCSCAWKGFSPALVKSIVNGVAGLLLVHVYCVLQGSARERL